MNKTKLIFISFVVVMSSVGFSAELVELNTSIRALGMGNAFTSVARDTESLFYNPAGLGRTSSYSWRIIELSGGLNGVDALTQAQDVQSGSEDDNPFSQIYGENIWVGANAKTALVAPSFGLAGFGTGSMGLGLRNPAYPEMNVNYFADYGAVIGVAFDLAQTMSFGFSARRLIRQGGEIELGPGDLAAQQDGTTTMEELLQGQKGVGFGLDAGMLFTFPTPFEPTLSFVWKNVGYTKFIAESGYDAPDFIRDEMIFGASMNFDFIVMNLRPSIDYKFANRYDIQNGKKLHMGLEVGFPFVEVRGGFYQGYYTLGTTLDLWLLRLDAATWGVELGEYPGQHEDRRYAVQLTIEFSLDPIDFSFLNLTGAKGGGASRKLKQRR